MRSADRLLMAMGGTSAVLLGAVSAALATVYPDTSNDAFEGVAWPHLEITSVEVTNDASNLSLKISLAGDPIAVNWGKYLVGVDTVAGGITSGNPWGRPISMSTGMDFFIGSWVDFGTGLEVHHDEAGAWVRDHHPSDPVDPPPLPVVTTDSVTLTFPLAYLNLVDGSTFKFDVYATGGGGTDSANDSSSNPAQSITAWNQAYDSGTLLSEYTVDIPAAPGGTWNVNASGNWSVAGNWTPAVPNAVGASATFGAVPTVPVTVTADVAVQVGSITFDNANTYTIDGVNTLTLDAASGLAAIDVVNGSHVIAAPVMLADDTTVTVTPGGSTLTLSNLQPATSALTKAGAGMLVVNNVRGDGLTVNAGTVRVAASGGAAGGVSRVATVAVTGTGKLDLTDNKLITSSPAGTFTGSTYDGVAGLVDSARGSAGNAQWDGPTGIATSDTRAINNGDLVSIGVARVSEVRAVADTESTTFAGQTVLGSDTLAMVTWGGDANLDGKINIDDYGRIDGNVGQSGSVFGWSKGDFNYDGKINIDDYGIIDGNINRQGAPFLTGSTTSVALEGASAVPEPVVTPLAVLGVGVLLRRRHRRCRDFE